MVGNAKTRAEAPPPHRPEPAGDAVYRTLREDIVAGRRMPNERLVEADLAAALNVGRAAVRSCLVRLEQDGLVVREPNRGARVRMVSEAEATEILQTRAVLEGLVAREAAGRATPEDLAGMRAILADMATRIDNDDLLGYSEANARLHAAIIATAQHHTAARLIAGLRAQVVRFQYRTILVPGRSRESLREHTRIVDAIAAADPDRAEAAMRAHLSHVAGTLRDTPHGF
jgi:DNA-binding GntR family transcriptional regulator